MREIARIAAQMFDKIIIRFDEDTRDRTPKETGSLIIDRIDEIDPVKEYTIISDIEHADARSGKLEERFLYYS